MRFTSPSVPRKPLCCGQSRRPSRPHLHGAFYGASCQLCILQGRLPQQLPRPTGGASNPLQSGAGVIAGTRRAHGGVDLRRTLAPLCLLPAGACARLRLGGGTVSIRPRIPSCLPCFLPVIPPALFHSKRFSWKPGQAPLYSLRKTPLLKPSWGPWSFVEDRERARLRAQWVALLQREGSPSFASLLKFLKVMLRTCCLFLYCGSGKYIYWRS